MQAPTNPPVCHCGQPTQLVPASSVYGPHSKIQGNYWACANYPECDSYVGVHRDSMTAAPLGTLADRITRAARIRAHAVFDSLWSTNLNGRRVAVKGKMSRASAYRLLAEVFSVRSAHISWMNEDECNEAIRRLTPYINESGE
jgi:hypothetical protein